LPKSSFSPGIPSLALEIPVAMMTALAATASPSSRTNWNVPPSADAEETFLPRNTAPADSAWRLPSSNMESPTVSPVPR